MQHSERIQLAKLSLKGLSVGDAFGEQFFTSPETIVTMIEERAIPKAPWKWTDDTAMALSIVDVLEHHSRIEIDSLARAFAAHYHNEPERGYGGGAHRILQALNEGVDWAEASTMVFNGEGSYGNGAAMRSAPIGAYFWDNFKKVVENAGGSAAPTHAHPEGRAGAIAVAIASAITTQMNKGELPKEGGLFLEKVFEYCPESQTRDGINKAMNLPLSFDVRTVANILGNGSYISSQDTVPLCLWLVARHLTDYEEAMWETLKALGDRDTTCAIVGSIVVLSDPLGIPELFLSSREPLGEAYTA